VRKLVAVDLPCGDAFVSAVKLIWDSGDAVLPLDQRLPDATKKDIVLRLGAHQVVHSGGKSSIGGFNVEPDDALVIHTSGTSGLPKGVVLTHEALMASSIMTSEALSVEQKLDVWLCCLPVSHIGGFSVVSRALHTGTQLLLHESFEARRCEAASRRDGASLVSLVPTALRRIDASLFKKILVGGSSIPDSLPENVVATYGMTETGSGVVYDGLPLTGVEIEIRNEEIFVKSPSLFRAYRDDSPALEKGWFATGDAGHIDANGKLLVSGRLEEVIVTGGEKVWPQVVERHINSLRLFREVAVVGRPDDEWGQVVTAVVLTDEASEVPDLAMLREQLASLLPRYALPKAIEVVDSFPRNRSGKLLRKSI